MSGQERERARKRERETLVRGVGEGSKTTTLVGGQLNYLWHYWSIISNHFSQTSPFFLFYFRSLPSHKQHPSRWSRCYPCHRCPRLASSWCVIRPPARYCSCQRRRPLSVSLLATATKNHQTDLFTKHTTGQQSLGSARSKANCRKKGVNFVVNSV